MILRKSIFISFSKLSNLITEEIIMFKKILSLAIVAMMLMSLIAVGASAAQVEVAEEAAAADDVASQGAEAEVAATGAGMIYFDAASAGWESASKILFYIYDLTNGSEFAAWGSSKKLGGTKGDNNIWSFDAEGLGVTAGNVYTIQFNNNSLLPGNSCDPSFNTSKFALYNSYLIAAFDETLSVIKLCIEIMCIDIEGKPDFLDVNDFLILSCFLFSFCLLEAILSVVHYLTYGRLSLRSDLYKINACCFCKSKSL